MLHARTVSLFAGPLGSALCNRFHARTVVFWGTVMTVVGQILSAYAPNLEFTYFSYAAIGGKYSSMAFSSVSSIYVFVYEQQGYR